VIWTFYDQVVKVEKGVGGARVCALNLLQHCQVKQGCQMSKYPTGYILLALLIETIYLSDFVTVLTKFERKWLFRFSRKSWGFF